MKSNARKLATGSIIATVILVGSLAHAGDMQGKHCDMHGFDMGGQGWGKMTEKLDLNDEQKALLKQQRETMKAVRAQKNQDREEMHQQMESLLTADSYDAERAEGLASKMADGMKQMVLQRSKTMHEFYQSLNEEQRAKFKKIHDKRQQRRQERYTQE